MSREQYYDFDVSYRCPPGTVGAGNVNARRVRARSEREARRIALAQLHENPLMHDVEITGVYQWRGLGL
jgi:hypothetical protein